MTNNTVRYEDEDAQRRQVADAQRRHDQQDRYARARKEQWPNKPGGWHGIPHPS